MKFSKTLKAAILAATTAVVTVTVALFAGCSTTQGTSKDIDAVYKSNVEFGNMGIYVCTANIVTTYTDGTYMYVSDMESLYDVENSLTIGAISNSYFGTYTLTEDEDTGIVTLSLSAPDRVIYLANIPGYEDYYDTDDAESLPEKDDGTKQTAQEILSQSKGWTMTVGENNLITKIEAVA